MDDTPDGSATDDADVPHLRFLKLLVTTLTVTMTVGFVVLIVLFVTRMPNRNAPPALPETIRLPDGSVAEAFTQGRDWYAVVTGGAGGDEILIYDRATGSLRQRIAVETAD